MRWNAVNVMDSRIQFISLLLSGDFSMQELCRSFGISRPTGYKWLQRYEQEGAAGLMDRSSAPDHHGRKTADAIADGVCDLRVKRPSWGPKKLVAYLQARQPGLNWPSPSTAGLILKRAGLVRQIKAKRRAPPMLEALTVPHHANHVWAADYKGWIDTPYGMRLEPLTVSDSFSRFLISLSATHTTAVDQAKPLFRMAFEEYGLPSVIRTDNGIPFCAPSVTGLTGLSVVWARLGIHHERIEPGQPQQNGRHERFHLTLKEAMQPPETTQIKQQKRFDHFRNDYNNERPHEALNHKTPAQFYEASPRPLPSKTPKPDYPEGTTIRSVRQNGEIKWKGNTIYISSLIAGDSVALTEIDNDQWAVQFYNRKIGVIDGKTNKLTRMKKQQQKGDANHPNL